MSQIFVAVCYRLLRAPAIGALLRQRRGAVSLLFAVSLPAMLGMLALAIDAGVWYLEQSRLQLAADAAAIGAARLLASSPTAAQLQSAALQGAEDAANSQLIGTLASPVSVSASSTQVTVTLQSQANGFFAQAVGAVVPTLTASATAGLQPPTACVLALNTSASQAIVVDNMGSITASGCGVFSDSSATCAGECSTGAVYLNSGTISGKSVGAVGSVNQSNSGSNTLSPSPPTSDAAAQGNPFASDTAPVPGGCSYTNGSFTSYGTYHFTQAMNVFCGNTAIGGNGSSDAFDPGIYYVVNGSLTFTNADITAAAGVTFVLTGSAPGAFSWTNYSYSATMTAPSSGPTAGILVWQTCGSSGGVIDDPFAGGSALTVSGAFYLPCGKFDLSNNAHIATAAGQSMSVVADLISVVGSASVAVSGSATSSGGGSVTLIQ